MGKQAGSSPSIGDASGEGPVHVAIKYRGRDSQEEYSRQNAGKTGTWERGRRGGFRLWQLGDSPPLHPCFSVVSLTIAPICCELTMSETLSSQDPSEVGTLLPSYIRGNQGTEKQ